MKIIRVDMTNKTISRQKVPVEYQGLGGRGLTSTMINVEVPPKCDPLGKENKLIIAPGLLTGTNLVNTSRMSVGAKSPLTNGIKESNVGGTAPSGIGRLGITAIVVEGKPPEGEFFLLQINKNGDFKLISAQKYEGMKTYALTKELFKVYGEKNGILCIGPAGELQLLSASIQTTDVDNRPCRAAGRGGLGAVMGAKGLKGLIVELGGKNADELVDKETFKKEAKVFAKAVKQHPFSGEVLPKLGTAMLVAPINNSGAFPSYNATKGILEGWESVSGETLTETIKLRKGKNTHQGCSQCIIKCSQVFVDKHGEYVTSSLEYETIWSMGGMLGINNLDVIAKLDFLCDDIGVDTMNAGVAMAVAMDAGYKKFGDEVAAIEMLNEIPKGTEIGIAIGNGPEAVGKYFKHHRVPVVKGQSIAAYDPRAVQGMAVTYATSPMGADHTAGFVVGQNLKALGGTIDPFGRKGQVEISRDAQIDNAAFDCLGLCLFAGSAATDIPEASIAVLKMINAKLGTTMTKNDYTALGVKVLKNELHFNRRAGLSKQDDRLPKMFYDEPLPPHNKTVVVTEQDMDSTFGSL